MARNRPSIFRSRGRLVRGGLELDAGQYLVPVLVFRQVLPLTTEFQAYATLGLLVTRSCMILDARRRVAAMDQGDFGGELRQERGLLDGRIAAADDGDLFPSIKVAVAGSAGADAVAAVWALLMPSHRAERP